MDLERASRKGSKRGPNIAQKGPKSNAGFLQKMQSDFGPFLGHFGPKPALEGSECRIP